MFTNYIKIAFRNLVKFKGYASINILGLAIGLACCLVIIRYLQYETSFDKHHVDGKDIYRVATEFHLGQQIEETATTPSPFAAAIKNDFPEVVKSTRAFRAPGVDKFILKHGEASFFEKNGVFADSTFFRVLTYDFVAGDPDHVLDEPNTVVLSKSMAEKLFGDQDPIGETIEIECVYDKSLYKVTGVFNKKTYRSHLDGEFYVSSRSGAVGQRFYQLDMWAGNNLYYSYVQLRPDADTKEFESKLPSWLDGYAGEQMKELGFGKRHFLESVGDIYLHSKVGFQPGPTGDITYVYILGSIAAFILLIACINFMNLATAKATVRAQEVGVRKVIGATRQMLMKQFMTEAFMYSLIAVVLGLGIAELALPVFNQLIHKELSLNLISGSDPVLPWLGLFLIVTTFVAGSYPAVYLSSFTPISIFKGISGDKLSVKRIRKGLVILQFVISIALIQGVLIINEQMGFIRNKSLGFNTEQQVIIPLNSSASSQSFLPLKNEFLKDSRVVSVGGTSTYPGTIHMNDMVIFGEGKSPKEGTHTFLTDVDPEYLELMEFKLLSGRLFSRDRIADTVQSTIINQTLAEGLGYTVETAVGKKMYMEWDGVRHDMDIIGVVGDFHSASLHDKIDGYAFFFNSHEAHNYLFANVKTEDLSGLLASLKSSWQTVNSSEPFEYYFLDEQLQKNYLADQELSGMIWAGTLLAIFISCLGLLGLATFAAERRMKEIGVRKVLGASIENILALLSKEFIALVVIALMVSTPLAWYFMSKWLEGFHYHIDMPWWTFVVSGLVAILITFATISWQSLKAARANPVDALRSE